jgi:hypothetical protein
MDGDRAELTSIDMLVGSSKRTIDNVEPPNRPKLRETPDFVFT